MNKPKIEYVYITKDNQYVLQASGTELMGFACDNEVDMQKFVARMTKIITETPIAKRDTEGHWQLPKFGFYLVEDTQNRGATFLLKYSQEICTNCGSIECEQAMLYLWTGSAFKYVSKNMHEGCSINHYWTSCETCGQLSAS